MVVRAKPPSGGRSAHQIEAGADAVTEPALRQRLAATLHGSCDRGTNGSTERGTCILLRSVETCTRRLPIKPGRNVFRDRAKSLKRAARAYIFDAAPPRTYAPALAAHEDCQRQGADHRRRRYRQEGGRLLGDLLDCVGDTDQPHQDLQRAQGIPSHLAAAYAAGNENARGDE